MGIGALDEKVGCSMTLYRFYRIKPVGGAMEDETRDFIDDLDALTHAERLAKKALVEIWAGTRLVARVKPNNVPLTARDSSSL